MEFEPSIALWKSRGSNNEVVLDVSTVNSKDGRKLVLVTTTDEILEFCAQSHKYINHWTFRAGGAHALRIGAVRNPQSQVFFGIRGAKKASQAETIVSWRNSDLDVSKWKHKALTEKHTSVMGVYVHPQLTEEALVVFDNGKFAAYDEDLAKVLDSSDVSVIDSVDNGDLDDVKVVWAGLNSDHRNPMKGSLFLSLLLKSVKDDSGYELVIYQIFSRKNRKDARLAVTLLSRTKVQNDRQQYTTTSGLEVSSCAFHANPFCYSIVWSSGDWQRIYFHHDVMANTLEVTSTQTSPAFNSGSTTASSGTPTNKKRKLSQTAASTASLGYVACAIGNFSYLVACATSSSSSSKTLTGWDAKFGVQVASMDIDFSSSSREDDNSNNRGSYGQLLRLVSSLNGEVIFVAYEQAVFMVNVKNKQSTLASVLGASLQSSDNIITSSAPALPNSVIDWAEVASNKVDPSTWKETLCSDSVSEKQLIDALSDASVTPTAAIFTKKFNESVKTLTKNGQSLSYHFLLAVTKRCVDSATLGLWGPLKDMITSKRISTRAVPALLPVLMKHSQFELLELAILHLIDIDERSIVRLLKFFIRKNNDPGLVAYVTSSSKKHASGNERKKSEEDDASAVADVSACERFVVALLGLPTNSVFLHHAIRELQLDEVLFLLAICKKFFYALVFAQGATPEPAALKRKSPKKRKSQETDGNEASPYQALVSPMAQKTFYLTQLPSSSQFCTWICVLIDGHFAQLVLTASKDRKAAAALQHLNTLVQRQLQSCEQFESVQSVLSNFISGVKLPQAHGIPDYSIESLAI